MNHILASYNSKTPDKIREGDRISLLHLDTLAPGKPVAMTAKHADGSHDEIQLKHSLYHEQIEWFKAGSALNHMRKKLG